MFWKGKEQTTKVIASGKQDWGFGTEEKVLLSMYNFSCSWCLIHAYFFFLIHAYSFKFQKAD